MEINILKHKAITIVFKPDGCSILGTDHYLLAVEARVNMEKHILT